MGIKVLIIGIELVLHSRLKASRFGYSHGSRL